MCRSALPSLPLIYPTADTQDIIRSVALLLWVSYAADAFWFCSQGPLRLTWEQIELAATSCSVPPLPAASPPSAPARRALSMADEEGSPAHPHAGHLLCQSQLLTANFNVDGLYLPTFLLTLSATLKLVVLLLLPGLDAALRARHGHGPAAALAGWAKSPVALAKWASGLATCTLLVGMFTLIARGGGDPTW